MKWQRVVVLLVIVAVPILWAAWQIGESRRCELEQGRRWVDTGWSGECR